MLKIAICDDTREERELVAQYAKRYFDARKQPAEFEIFHSMQDVLDTGRAYDLYVKLIVSKMADAVIEANQGADVESAEEAESAEADAAEE